MSREIKFRIYDKIENEFLYTGLDNYDYFFGWAIQHDGSRNTEHCVFMQYTGLKDKNGVDIYEGDIVKGFIHDKEIEGQRNDFIIFQNGKFEFKNTPSDLISFCYPLSIKQIQIIGNIHENPELLNQPI